MKSYCSDVNTIFAFVDKMHKFHKIVFDYFNSIKSERYVLLNHVMTTFIFTYRDNLKRIGEIISSAVNNVKRQLTERNRKIKYLPSDVLKNTMIKRKIAELVKGFQEKEFKPTDYDYYKNILLKDFPLIELLNDDKKFEEFDSHYVQLADGIVNKKLKEFESFFESIEKSPKLDRTKVMELRKELKEIKKQNDEVFISPDDEDIRLSSEFMAYCILRKIRLNILSMDKNLINSLKFVRKKKTLNCGEIKFLLS